VWDYVAGDGTTAIVTADEMPRWLTMGIPLLAFSFPTGEGMDNC